MTTQGRDLLVAAPERWDEACFSVPAIRALMASGLQTGVICREPQKEFWATVEGLEVLSFPEKTKAKHAAAQLKGIWQAALAWEPGFAADAVKIAGIPRRLGPCIRALRRHLTHPLAIMEHPTDHRVRFYLSIVEEMGINTRHPQFFAPCDLGIEPEPRAVLLSPDSDFGPSHEWPLQEWRKLATDLIDDGYELTIASVGREQRVSKALARLLGDTARCFHAAPLAGTLPLLAVHGLVIASDGSLPHVAAHAGATCVTLFGPNDPTWKRPLGKRHAVAHRHVECAPCLLAKCPMDMRCQNELQASHVLKAAKAKLDAMKHREEPPIMEAAAPAHSLA